jgi:L-ascorbate oxidase
MLFLSLFSIAIVWSILGTVFATTQCHDETFVPDAVLRITASNISQSCLPPKNVVLVNGTSPGPELRLLEGNTYWIRVYNDVSDQNLTMVRILNGF